MRKLALAFAAFCACAFGQATPSVSVAETPPLQATEVLVYRDGSNNTEYQCVALGNSVVSVWTRSASTSIQPKTISSVDGSATLTSIVDAANTSTITTSADHGLAVGQWVTISGATVDTDLNGSYKIASVGSSTTFTITTANVTDATMNESTLRVTTTAPRTNAEVWAVQKMFYTTNYFDRSIWAKGNTSFDKACASRTSYF